MHSRQAEEAGLRTTEPDYEHLGQTCALRVSYHRPLERRMLTCFGWQMLANNSLVENLRSTHQRHDRPGTPRERLQRHR